MDFVGPDQMRQVMEMVDGLGLHREAVRVPLSPVPGGSLGITDGRLVIEVPADQDLDGWLAEIPDRVRALPGFASLKRADADPLG